MTLVSTGYTLIGMSAKKTRFFGSMWGVLYIASGCAQILAIVDSVPEYLPGAATWLSFVIAAIIAEIPFVGTAAGVYGAHVNWDLPVFAGIALFVWPIVILLVYVLRFRNPVTSSLDDVSEDANAEPVEPDTTVFSPLMANMLRQQVEDDEAMDPSATDSESVSGIRELNASPAASGESEQPEIIEAAAEVLGDTEPVVEPEPVQSTDTLDDADDILDLPSPSSNPETTEAAVAIVRDHITSCRELILERTNAAQISSLVRSIDLELPLLFCAVCVLSPVEVDGAELVNRILLLDIPLPPEPAELLDWLDDRTELYRPGITEEAGAAADRFAKRIGRLGDGLMIRIVNDAIADCSAALAAAAENG